MMRIGRKQVLAILLALTFSAVLISCGKSAEEQWQEQYDLGVKYVSEGNYEEAIIAFTAAIEIDAKNVDAYLGLADIYEAQGNISELRAILQAGAEATGDAELTRRLEELPPELPQAYMEAMAGMNLETVEDYQRRLQYRYVPMTGELAEALADVLAMGSSGASEPAQPELVQSGEFLGTLMQYADENGRVHFWSMTADRAIVTVRYANTMVTVDYRTQDKEGFRWVYADTSDTSGYWRFTKGQMKDYLYDGAYTCCDEHWQLLERQYDRLSQTEVENVNLREREEVTGTAKGECIDGEIQCEKVTLEGWIGLDCTMYRVYEEGISQAVYTNGAGAAVRTKYVLEDGRTAYDDDTLEILETTRAYEAGDNVGFGGTVYDDSYKKTPYNGFTG